MAKVKTLEPVIESPEDYEDLQQEILDALLQEVYLPLLEILDAKKSVLKNSIDDLVSAIRSGRIVYSRGQFTGRYSSTLTRELRRLGAKWDRKHGSWKIPLPKLPVEVRAEISTAQSKYEEKGKQLSFHLKKVDAEKLTDRLNFKRLFDATLKKFDKKFKRSVQSIAVAPDLSEAQKKAMADEYVNNLRLSIVDFTEKETVELRKKIEKMVLQGHRYETIVDKIRKSYNVTENKAHFLARQETNLAVAKYRESRYKEIGVEKYMWRCVKGSANHPVRPMHKQHDGKIFSWDNPPIVNDRGERKHPSEDFNCRCIAIPVVEF
jgi:SPP1 gp7 family putative phage head morphogenesis protein